MKEFKLFTLTEYEKEEEYLRNKHQQGYEFVSVSMPGYYTFKKCEPKDVVYRLDYNPASRKDKQAYLQMFEDAGWEYLQDMNEYSYFRKEADLTNELENEIFCDNESKLEMAKRVIKTKFIPAIIVLITCMIPNVINCMNTDFSAHPTRAILYIILYLLVLLCIVVMTRVIVGYIELRNKYKK